MSGLWEVFRNGRSLGIIESNYAFASKYWATRPGCELRPRNLR